MVTRTLLFLAEASFQLGLIGIDEYIERCEVAWWLGDEGALGDPREPRDAGEGHEHVEAHRPHVATDSSQTGTGTRVDEPDWLRFLFRNTWLFTRSDPDPYPSTPHGHLQSANRAWPKLNPYTGRAFKAKHQEEVSLRLGKTEMKNLWQDEAFRNFCRSYVLWYMEQFPYHRFSVAYPLRFPRW